MTAFVYITLIGWLLTSMLLFALWPGRRATLVTVLLGFLLLPQVSIDLSGPVDLSKGHVIAVALLVGMMFSDARRFFTSHPRWFDAPMIAWCLVPLASSLSNNLGAYDGFSGVVSSTLMYGVPYLAGRLYIRTEEDLRALVMAVALGGILYVPLCWFEIRMSPNLHFYIYGEQQHFFVQTKRFGGYRPMVFLQHGLAVGLWMAAATVAAYGVWRGKWARTILGMQSGIAVLLLTVTTVFVKSLGAVMLLGTWFGAALLSRFLRSLAPLIALVALAPMYVTLRIATDWTPASIIEEIDGFSSEHAGSLATRVTSDALVRDRALMRPWFGWGGWNRFREDLGGILTDSMWSISLGQRGLVGLLGFFGALVLAQWLALQRYRRSNHRVGDSPALEALISILAIHTLDCMVNAMVNPMFPLIAGGLLSWTRDPSPVTPAHARTANARGW